MTPKYTLTYFNVRWLAEPIRFLLHYTGQPFEDKRLEWHTWIKTPHEENLKKYKYGKLPHFVERDNSGSTVVELSQSFTILRYLARQHGLSGENSAEQARCEEYADCVQDILKDLNLMFSLKKESSKTKARDVLLKTTIPRYFHQIEEDLAAKKATAGQKKKEYFPGTAKSFVPLVGNQVTWVDFVLAHYFFEVQVAFGDNPPDFERLAKLMANWSELKAHQEQVFALQGIREWVEKRPKTRH